MENIEVWKSIKGYEGKYEVSSLGRVKSLSRKITREKGFFISKEVILNTTINPNGYEYLCLCIDGKAKKHKIHQLVAIAFLNHKPNGLLLVVNHINGIKTDNRLVNLEIVTQRKNSSNKNIKTTSNYTGVCWNKAAGKWHSAIRIKSKCTHLGYFKTEIEAHKSYQDALLSIK